MHAAASDRALDEDGCVRGSRNHTRDTAVVALVIALVATLGVLAVVRWNHGAAKLTRDLLDELTPSGFLELAAVVLIVSLALAVPMVADVADSPLPRAGRALHRSARGSRKAD